MIGDLKWEDPYTILNADGEVLRHAFEVVVEMFISFIPHIQFFTLKVTIRLGWHSMFRRMKLKCNPSATFRFSSLPAPQIASRYCHRRPPQCDRDENNSQIHVRDSRYLSTHDSLLSESTSLTSPTSCSRLIFSSWQENCCRSDDESGRHRQGTKFDC